LVAFIVAWAIFAVGATGILVGLGVTQATAYGPFLLVNGVISLIPAILLGWLCGRVFEGLPYRALGAAFTKSWFTHFVSGCIAGAVTLSIGVATAAIFGGLSFNFDAAAGTTQLLRSLAVSFAIFAAASAFEEALFRGYILQTFARSGMAWLAIVLTSLFFGAVHLGNPNVTVLSTTNTILAGIWFSVAYLKTRDLWFVWGMHLMWNWMQGSFFGIEVSGITSISTAPLLREIDSGPAWLTGSTYGIEGGIVCTLAILASTAVIWLLPVAKPDPELHAMTSPTPRPPVS
jgi:uncharacterized protein